MKKQLKDKIRLLAFTSPYPTQKGYDDYADCGFDIALIDPIGKFGTPEALKPFEYCKNAGIVGIPVCPSWDGVKDHEGNYCPFPRPYDKTDYNQIESFYGAYLWDEPESKYWDELVDNIHRFQNAYPDKTVFVNITVCYADKALLEEYPLDEEGFGHDCVRATVRNYCNKVLDEIQGERILMFDYYPLNEENGENVLIHDYLWGYDELSVIARDRGYSLFTFVQTTGTGKTEFGHGRELISPADYRFQCMVALAYGCTGIGSFCYQSFFKPEMALVCDEELQPTYFFVQRVNRELNKFSDTYMQYTWEKAGLQLSKTPLQHSLTTLKRMNNNATAFDGIEISSIKYDTLVGQFEAKDGKSKAYMFVNYIEPSQTAQNKIVVNIANGAETVKVYQRGHARVKKVKDGKIELSLSVGEGAFVVVEKK